MTKEEILKTQLLELPQSGAAFFLRAHEIRYENKLPEPLLKAMQEYADYQTSEKDTRIAELEALLLQREGEVAQLKEDVLHWQKEVRIWVDKYHSIL